MLTSKYANKPPNLMSVFIFNRKLFSMQFTEQTPHTVHSTTTMHFVHIFKYPAKYWACYSVDFSLLKTTPISNELRWRSMRSVIIIQNSKLKSPGVKRPNPVRETNEHWYIVGLLEMIGTNIRFHWNVPKNISLHSLPIAIRSLPNAHRIWHSNGFLNAFGIPMVCISVFGILVVQS